ncbi:TIGR04222 domain-containing membrane protein [Streptomyces sp. NPDC002588]|uniref:TIGR04222 domain-containing membrane protein n=1 Tax=Streptomyces sp. NPDC002588 TaxID=3154419 RepID=UPI00331AC0F5
MVPEASTGPGAGHIVVRRDPSARGRRAPPQGVTMSVDSPVLLQPYEVALLRGGPRAAVTAAVVDLHLRGVVEAGRPGRLRTSEASEAAGQAPPPLPPLAEAVREALVQPVGLPELSTRPAVRAALADLVKALRSARLLRVLPPRRSRAGRRTLAALRAEHPLPESRKGVAADAAVMAVALHGEAALSLLVPRFAMRAGLVPRAEVTDDKAFHRRAPRGGGGGTGGGFSCGAGASCGSSY